MDPGGVTYQETELQAGIGDGTPKEVETIELYNNSGSQAEMESAREVHGKEGSAENNSMHKKGVTVVVGAAEAPGAEKGSEVTPRSAKAARSENQTAGELWQVVDTMVSAVADWEEGGKDPASTFGVAPGKVAAKKAATGQEGKEVEGCGDAVWHVGRASRAKSASTGPRKGKSVMATPAAPAGQSLWNNKRFVSAMGLAGKGKGRSEGGGSLKATPPMQRKVGKPAGEVLAGGGRGKKVTILCLGKEDTSAEESPSEGSADERVALTEEAMFAQFSKWQAGTGGMESERTDSGVAGL